MTDRNSVDLFTHGDLSYFLCTYTTDIQGQKVFAAGDSWVVGVQNVTKLIRELFI